MENYYFTFGSDESYPYPNRYLIVQAFSYHKAICAFREKYPDHTENTIHCAFIYTQDEWERVCAELQAQEPAEIITTAA